MNDPFDIRNLEVGTIIDATYFPLVGRVHRYRLEYSSSDEKNPDAMLLQRDGKTLSWLNKIKSFSRAGLFIHSSTPPSPIRELSRQELLELARNNGYYAK